MNVLRIGIIIFLFIGCAAQQQKINGISFVGTNQVITPQEITPVVEINANWASVMPFGYVKSLHTPNVIFNIDRQWWGERKEGVLKTVELLNEQKIQVMLKPQIWVWGGEFTGDIKMTSEAEWKTFEKTYENFILFYAKLAEEIKIPILCIGTELHTFIKIRPDFWHRLIAKIRLVYTGKLTYAENWDQYNKVHFWNQLDYIGIDAYFPIATTKTPDVDRLKKGWQSYKQKMITLYNQTQKPILFTEYGYRSIDYTAKEPWATHTIAGSVNLKAQENALLALYEEFWYESWFAGGFLWKWFPDHPKSGGKKDNRFTIQNKPAENLIRNLYHSAQ